jgi:SAM-dependent methyltransferase
MARLAARLKLGYYPLAESEAIRIRSFLSFPQVCAALDPCAGTGRAFHLIASGTGARLHGIELDASRAEQAQQTRDAVVYGSAFDVHCPVESFSLLYLNPPYDDEMQDGRARRSEALFLEHCFRWLKPKGVLVLVIPSKQVTSCRQTLASYFRDLAVYRLPDPASAQYNQVVVFGTRRTRYERERLKDWDFLAMRNDLAHRTAAYAKVPVLPDPADRQYLVPDSQPVVPLQNTGLPLDQLEDMLQSSRAYREMARSVFAPPVHVAGRPLTPLHDGHAGILSCSGLLNGVFGDGSLRHIACWQTTKKVDHFEETDESGTKVIRDRERFSQCLTLLYADGRIAELSEDNDNDEKRPSTHGPG